MELTKHSPIRTFFRRNGLALLLTGGLFALMYIIVFNFRAGDSDYIDHLLWALAMSPEDIVSSFYDGSERLWHICIKFLFPGHVKNMWAAAGIVTALAEAITYFLVYKALETAISEKFPRWLLALLTLSAFLVNTLALPGQHLYLGRGNINPWHNPTTLMSRPFAAAVFFMTVRIYNRRRYGCHRALTTPDEDGRPFSFSGGFWAGFREPVYTAAELILYPLCLLFCTYAKPAFLQYFAPAVLIFLLIDVIRSRGKLLPFCIKLALAYIPAGLILLSQFFSFFDLSSLSSAAGAAGTSTASSGYGMAIYFVNSSTESFGDFINALSYAIFGMVNLCAFPLFILLVDARRSFRSAACRLGFIGLLVARLEAMLLHETGDRAIHGNFLWGYYMAVWMLWCTAIGRFVQLWTKTDLTAKIARWGGLLLLLWHLAVGILYIVRILQTGLYQL